MKIFFTLLTIFVSFSALALPEDKELVQTWNCSTRVKDDPKGWVFFDSNQDQEIAVHRTIKACESKFPKIECDSGLNCFMSYKLAD